MPVIICMLRGINVGGHNLVKMEALRALCASLNFRNPQTYVQSGNVIFSTPEQNLSTIAGKLTKGFIREFGFQPAIILRTATELRNAIGRNPFAKHRDIVPSQLLVSFLAGDPGDDVRKRVRAFKSEVEDIRIDGQEMYIYFPSGMARPKFSWAALDKIIGMPSTGRNWNSVTKMLAIAEKLEATEAN